VRVLDFYDFMQKRENIRLRRAAGRPWPWTDDQILQDFKFTNVKRLYDRTTQELLARLYRPNAERPFAEHLMMAGVARYFGRWEFADAVGWREDFGQDDEDYVAALAAARMDIGLPVFTGAYIITNQGIKANKEDVVAHIFLKGLRLAAPGIAAVVKAECRWEPVIGAMMKITGFGGTGFMAKEVLLDTMLVHGVWPGEGPLDLNTWCPSGPGARRGAARVCGDDKAKPLNEADTLVTMRQLYAARTTCWPSDYAELELHDIQFQLCEFDKYERVRLEQGRPRSRYRQP
jgi:hypothetical protein